MKVATLSALPVVLALSFTALAQQPATPAPATTASAPPTVAATTMSPQECGKMMDKMATAGDKSAMPMKEGCDKAAQDTANKKAKNKKHNHSQFHKSTG